MEMLDKQVEIDRGIVNALIAATPESWNAMEMGVERVEGEDGEGLAISITSLEGLREPVGASMELVESVFKLEALFQEYEVPLWTKAVYQVRQEAPDDWRYQIEFAY